MGLCLYRCKTEDIILHGDITGKVTDASTGEPVEAATVKIDQSGDSTTTGSDGTYLLRNLNPASYEIQASKFTYALYKRNVTVAPAETIKEIDFPLIGIPQPDQSVSFLDFRIDSTSLSFSILNSGKGSFTYFITTSQTWIGVSPAYGDITNETDNITVTINKTGLSKSIYKEFIKVTSFSGLVPLTDIIIPVYLNGVMDGDGNYYKIVTIGTQTWTAENLKTTRYNDGIAVPLIKGETAWNSLNTPGYCWYNDLPTYKDTYGALYNWYAVTTGKLCPTGWHVPTNAEWTTLTDYLGGLYVGYKLKETGTTHWPDPNYATNESGFTALPGGYRDLVFGFMYLTDGIPSIGKYGAWFSSTEQSAEICIDRWMKYSDGNIVNGTTWKKNGESVRCLKNN